MKDLTRNNSKVVSVRITLEQYSRIRDAAQKAEIEMSAFMRKAVLNLDIPPAARRKSLDREALGKLLGSLNRIGSNINMIARAANAYGQTATYHEAERDRAELVAAVRAIVRELE